MRWLILVALCAILVYCLLPDRRTGKPSPEPNTLTEAPADATVRETPTHPAHPAATASEPSRPPSQPAEATAPEDASPLAIRLVADGTGQPIVHTRITIDGKAFQTDDRGRVQLGTGRGTPSPVIEPRVVESDGWTPVWFYEAALHFCHELELRLQPTATIEGTILDFNGAPVAGAEIEVTRDLEWTVARETATDMQGWGLAREAFSQRADDTGRFRLCRLPANAPLAIRGRSNATALARLATRIRLRPGETREIVLRSPPAGTLSVSVVDSSGQLVQGAYIQVREPGGGLTVSHSARTDGSGTRSFEHVRCGQARITVSADEDGDFAETHVRVALPEHGCRVHRTIVVHRGLTITGTVVQASGAPVPGSTVFARSGEHRCTTISNAAGQFRIGPVVPGEHRVFARGSGDYRESAPVVANAGDVDVRLVVPLGGTITGKLASESLAALESEYSAWICVRHRETDTVTMDSFVPEWGYRIRGLEVGTYDVHAGIDPPHDLVASASGILVRAGETSEVAPLHFRRGAKVVISGAATMSAAPDRLADFHVCEVSHAGQCIRRDYLHSTRTELTVIPGKLQITVRRDRSPSDPAWEKTCDVAEGKNVEVRVDVAPQSK